MNIKQFILASLLYLLWSFPATFARTVEVDVFGMTCPFCVDSLQRKFSKMEHVNKVEVSLKLKKVRLQTEANAPDLDTIKQAVLDAGFTPTKVTIVDTDNPPADANTEDTENNEK